MARRGQLTGQAGAELAGAVADRFAGRTVQVAQQPSAVGPRQHSERGGIGQHHHVARSGEPGLVEPATGRPDRVDVFLPGVLQEKRAGDANTRTAGIGHQIRPDRFASQHAVQVGERQPHASQLASFDLGYYFGETITSLDAVDGGGQTSWACQSESSGAHGAAARRFPSCSRQHRSSASSPGRSSTVGQ